MNTESIENPTAAPDPASGENRDARVRRMRADMDARIQAHRHRQLPAWLASRPHRRAVALLPVVPLAGGLFAGTMPDSIARSALMTAVAAVCVAGILVLRQATRLLDAVPDRLLDEREIGERDNAYKRAHALVVGLMTLVAVLAVADGTLTKIAGTPLVPGDGWISVTFAAVLVGSMLPAAVVAWRWVDAPADATDH